MNHSAPLGCGTFDSALSDHKNPTVAKRESFGCRCKPAENRSGQPPRTGEQPFEPEWSDKFHDFAKFLGTSYFCGWGKLITSAASLNRFRVRGK